MSTSLNGMLTEKFHSYVEFFQLRKVDLPQDFEDAIQLTEVQKQDIQKAYAEKNQTVIQLQTTTIQAVYSRDQFVTLYSLID